jgi:hypothetical protein
MKGISYVNRKESYMTFDVYFSISRAAVELIAIGLIVGATAYMVKDLMDEETANSVK